MQDPATWMSQNGGGQDPGADKILAQQYTDASRREQNINGIDNWEQSRNPYYETLYNGQMQNANAGINQQYDDSLKRLQLQHATRGTTGGSQEQYNNAQLGAAASMRSAQAAQSAQGQIQGLRQQDKAFAHSLRQQQQGPNAYTDQYTNSLQHQQTMRGQTYGVDADMWQQNQAINQQYKNHMSQIYGQAIKNGFDGIGSMVGGGGGGGGGGGMDSFAKMFGGGGGQGGGYQATQGGGGNQYPLGATDVPRS